MKLITHKQITELGISPVTCLDWVKEAFCMKKNSQMPAKISVHPDGNDFYTSMPCLLPEKFDRFGLKLVHRVKGSVPSLGSDLLLYKASSGELLALLDCSWITTMRTGAVATLAAQTFRKNNACTYGFIGLGNTARSTVLCLLSSEPDKQFEVLLLRYKNQAELFKDRFSEFKNVNFTIVDDVNELISASDVIFSCITDACGLICPDATKFKVGCTLIPIHVRGFQNCDTVFDKVFGDDTTPLKSWQHFNEFKKYAELQDVLEGTAKGRESDEERILSYNYGLAIHDVLFASRIEEMFVKDNAVIPIERECSKFWI